MNIRVKVLLFCINCTLFIACDRVTKIIAKDNLVYGQSVSYFHDTFRLQYIENTGAALSMGDNLPKAASFWLLGIFPLVILAIMFVYTITHLYKMSRLMLLSFSLVIAGGLSNIIDRLIYDRHVIDFMNMGIENIRTGIFNVADVCVTAGVIGFLIAYIRNKEPGKMDETLMSS